MQLCSRTVMTTRGRRSPPIRSTARTCCSSTGRSTAMTTTCDYACGQLHVDGRHAARWRRRCRQSRRHVVCPHAADLRLWLGDRLRLPRARRQHLAWRLRVPDRRHRESVERLRALDPRNASNTTAGAPGLDGSAVSRFDPLRDNNTGIIDVLYYDENDGTAGYAHHASIYYKAIVIGSPDTTPPSTPTALTQTDATATSVTSSWNAATDNVAISGYTLYNGATAVGSVSTTAERSAAYLARPRTRRSGGPGRAGNHSDRATTLATMAACAPRHRLYC